MTRTWSITTTGGERMSGYLPGWAEHDPSKRDVTPGRLVVELSDITHEAVFGGHLMRVSPAGQDPGHDTAVFAAHMQCRPFASDPGPVVNIQIVDDLWVMDLDPPGVADIAEKFRSFADLLTSTVAPALTSGRRDWRRARAQGISPTTTDQSKERPAPP